MQLKYVGARPVVSKNGVSFDETKPDHYTFIAPVLDLLEAMKSMERAEGLLDLSEMTVHSYKPKELTESVLQCCDSVDEIMQQRGEQANERIDQIIKDIKENRNLSPDEQTALFGNIDYMRDYYLNYVTNESIYRSLLHSLADRLHQLHYDDILFPIGKKHGLVMSHLIPVLRDHKPGYDATLTIQERDGERVGKLSMNRPKGVKL